MRIEKLHSELTYVERNCKEPSWEGWAREYYPRQRDEDGDVLEEKTVCYSRFFGRFGGESVVAMIYFDDTNGYNGWRWQFGRGQFPGLFQSKGYYTTAPNARGDLRDALEAYAKKFMAAVEKLPP